MALRLLVKPVELEPVAPAPVAPPPVAQTPPVKVKKPRKAKVLAMTSPEPSAPAVATTVGVAETVQTPQKVAVESDTLNEVEALTREFIALHTKFMAADGKTLVKRMEEIRKSLAEVANETMDGQKPAVFKCAEGEIEFSERGTDTTVISPQQLIGDLSEKFTPEIAFSLVNIALTPLRKVLSSLELAKYVKETDGSRILKAVRPATTGQ